MSTPDYFARIVGNVNLSLLQEVLVSVVGVGTVGSQITMELARCGVSHLRLFDGDHLEESNRTRHVLPKQYVGRNKAEALTLYLADEVPLSRPEAVPRYIDGNLSDSQLDDLLKDADLVVATTDDREAQRRIGRRALALSIPAIFPALYGGDGGEVVVQIDARFPCFFCWDGFRRNEAQLRGVNALNATTLPVIHTSIRLCLGILDPQSDSRRLLVGEQPGSSNQVFVQRQFAALDMAPLERRPNCPSCAVGPSPLRPEAVEAWETAIRTRETTTTGSQPADIALSVTTPQPRNWQLAWVIAALGAVALVVLISSLGSKSSAEISHAYKIKVDYNRSLASMIGATHLKRYRRDGVTEKRFPIKTGPPEVSVVLVRLTGLKTHSETEAEAVGEPGIYVTEWLASLGSLGLRPATLPELLAFRKQYPERRKSPVVALGSIAHAIYGGLEYCAVAMNYLVVNFAADSDITSGSEYRFLAVRE